MPRSRLNRPLLISLNQRASKSKQLPNRPNRLNGKLRRKQKRSRKPRKRLKRKRLTKKRLRRKRWRRSKRPSSRPRRAT